MAAPCVCVRAHVCVCSSSLTNWLRLRSGFVASCGEISFFLFRWLQSAALLCMLLHNKSIDWPLMPQRPQPRWRRFYRLGNGSERGSCQYIIITATSDQYLEQISILCVCGPRGGPRGPPAPRGRHSPSPFISALSLPVWLYKHNIFSWGCRNIICKTVGASTEKCLLSLPAEL